MNLTDHARPHNGIQNENTQVIGAKASAKIHEINTRPQTSRQTPRARSQ